jgi:hypothetical protein
LGLYFLAPPQAPIPSLQVLVAMAVNLGCLMFAWGGVTLLIASTSQRRGAAGWIAGLLGLATFLLDYLGRAWPAVERFAWVSPFRYYDPLALLMGRPLNASHVFTLMAIGAVTSGFAYIFFLRRDITH